MKNSWLIGVFAVGVVIVVVVAFNYDGNRAKVPLSEIFPEDEVMPVDVEYEFVDSEDEEKTQQEYIKKPEIQEKIAKVQKIDKLEEVNKKMKSIDTSQFTIQIASFKNRVRAEEFLESGRKKGYTMFIMSKDLGSKGVWYRVYSGKFKNKIRAAEFLKDIKKVYKNSFLTYRKL